MVTRTATVEAERTISVVSQALGLIEVPCDDVITFVEPLAGFPGSNRYALLPHVRQDGREDAAICWLQSIDEPHHAFVITDPWGVVPDYAPEISYAEAEQLGLRSFEDARLFGILTVPGDPRELTINLRAPVVINARTRTGKQVVLVGETYDTRHRLSR